REGAGPEASRAVGSRAAGGWARWIRIPARRCRVRHVPLRRPRPAPTRGPPRGDGQQAAGPWPSPLFVAGRRGGGGVARGRGSWGAVSGRGGGNVARWCVVSTPPFKVPGGHRADVPVPVYRLQRGHRGGAEVHRRR